MSALFMLVVPSTASIRLSVASKIIVDTIAGKMRPGGGGVQAAAGARLAAKGPLTIDLHAPVGMDFDISMLDPLKDSYLVNVSAVTALPEASMTPGEKISYENPDGRMRFEQVGWDYWGMLCAWEPSLATKGYDALHVIIEGGGDGEVRAILQACEASRQETGSFPTVGVEPILHEVHAAALDGLRSVTRLATVCSPDLATAACIGKLVDAEAEAAGRSSSTFRPDELPPDVLASLRSSVPDLSTPSTVEAAPDDGSPPPAAPPPMRCQLVDLAAAVYDELTMQPGALLAIRDGEHGSYIYTRPAPDAPIYMWLADASSREYEWFARVPAAKLERVADPTGAGNAYAGALTAQLAAGVGPEAAAATATAVGAAFCAADAWAPPDVDAATAWVQTASTRVAERIRVIVGGDSA